MIRYKGVNNYQVEKRSCVRDETCSDQFSNENRQVGSDGNHPVLQVIKKLATIFLNLDNLEHKKSYG